MASRVGFQPRTIVAYEQGERSTRSWPAIATSGLIAQVGTFLGRRTEPWKATKQVVALPQWLDSWKPG